MYGLYNYFVAVVEWCIYDVVWYDVHVWFELGTAGLLASLIPC